MFSKSELDQIFDEYNEIKISASAKLPEIRTKNLNDSSEENKHYRDFIEFQINKIDLVLDKIDHIMDNYADLDFQIESYELNGMSKEIISLRKEYSVLI
ncbi:MAG: hypothetical protein Q8M06_11430 [Methanobacteriaceae archaeon]|jgi:hypothetical protein|nr:hypothetical protein [Methanobacteriaceae archaeon]MDZ4170954.1 hypothetical protein [Methanobacteriaceae archaeon]